MQITATRTTFTENEVYGTACGDCGHVDFTPVTPSRCTECDSDNLDPAEGCEIPRDDDHTTTAMLSGSAVELARWMRDRALTEWDGGSTVYAVDGSHIIDYHEGRREELTVSGDADTLAAIFEVIGHVAVDNADSVSDRELYR